RLDVVRHLAGGDYQHCHGESERRINERLEASHLDSAQAKPLQPRERVEVRRKRGRYLFFVLSHAGEPIQKVQFLGASFFRYSPCLPLLVIALGGRCTVESTVRNSTRPQQWAVCQKLVMLSGKTLYEVIGVAPDHKPRSSRRPRCHPCQR